MVKIGLIQCPTLPGEQQTNLETVASFANEARQQQCDVVCFGEYMLTGHPKTLADPSTHAVSDKTLSRLHELAMNTGVTILVGGFREVGKGIRSSCIVAQRNGDVQFLDKLHPGTSEKAYLTAGEELQRFSLGKADVKFSALICNDWHQPWCPFLLAHHGTRVLFAPFSTPHEPSKRIVLWRRFMPTRAYDCRSFILACNVMKEDRESGGGLAAWGPDGAELFSYNEAAPHMGIVDVPIESLKKYTTSDSMKYKDFPAQLNKEAMYKNIKCCNIASK